MHLLREESAMETINKTTEHGEVYIVQTILQTVFLVAVDFEVLALAGSKIGHGLSTQFKDS